MQPACKTLTRFLTKEKKPKPEPVTEVDACPRKPVDELKQTLKVRIYGLGQRFGVRLAHDSEDLEDMRRFTKNNTQSVCLQPRS